MLMIRQISVDPTLGVSVIGAAQWLLLIIAMIGLSKASCDSSSLSTTSRVLTASDSLGMATAGSRAGNELVSGVLRFRETLNIITNRGTMSSPPGNGAFASLVSTKEV